MRKREAENLFLLGNDTETLRDRRQSDKLGLHDGTVANGLPTQLGDAGNTQTGDAYC